MRPVGHTPGSDFLDHLVVRQAVYQEARLSLMKSEYSSSRGSFFPAGRADPDASGYECLGLRSALQANQKVPQEL